MAFAKLKAWLHKVAARTIDDLWKFAKLCRVATVMRPYLEATT